MDSSFQHLKSQRDVGWTWRNGSPLRFHAPPEDAPFSLPLRGNGELKPFVPRLHPEPPDEIEVVLHHVDRVIGRRGQVRIEAALAPETTTLSGRLPADPLACAGEEPIDRRPIAGRKIDDHFKAALPEIAQKPEFPPQVPPEAVLSFGTINAQDFVDPGKPLDHLLRPPGHEDGEARPGAIRGLREGPERRGARPPGFGA